MNKVGPGSLRRALARFLRRTRRPMSLLLRANCRPRLPSNTSNGSAQFGWEIITAAITPPRSTTATIVPTSLTALFAMISPTTSRFDCATGRYRAALFLLLFQGTKVAAKTVAQASPFCPPLPGNRKRAGACPRTQLNLPVAEPADSPQLRLGRNQRFSQVAGKKNVHSVLAPGVAKIAAASHTPLLHRRPTSSEC